MVSSRRRPAPVQPHRADRADPFGRPDSGPAGHPLQPPGGAPRPGRGSARRAGALALLLHRAEADAGRHRQLSGCRSHWPSAAGLGSALAYGAGTAGQHAAAYTGRADAGKLVELLRNPRWLLATVGGPGRDRPAADRAGRRAGGAGAAVAGAVVAGRGGAAGVLRCAPAVRPRPAQLPGADRRPGTVPGPVGRTASRPDHRAGRCHLDAGAGVRLGRPGRSSSCVDARRCHGRSPSVWWPAAGSAWSACWSRRCRRSSPATVWPDSAGRPGCVPLVGVVVLAVGRLPAGPDRLSTRPARCQLPAEPDPGPGRGGRARRGAAG